MGEYTSYFLYQKYEKRGDQDWLPCYPNVYSVDGDGTMPLVMKKEYDQQCGYTGGCDPQYDWVEIPIDEDYECDECDLSIQTRWVDYTDAFTYFGDYKYGIQILETKVEDGEWTRTNQTKYTTNPIGKAERKMIIETSDGSSYSVRCGTSDGRYYNYPSTMDEWFYQESTDNSGLFENYKLCHAIPDFFKVETDLYSTGINQYSWRDEPNDWVLRPTEYGQTITGVTFGDCVTEIGNTNYCTGYNPNTNNDKKIGFMIYPNLVSVTLPNTVEKIGTGVFSGNTGLTTITFPDSLKNLGAEEPAELPCNGSNGIEQNDCGTFEGCGLVDVNTNKIEQIGRKVFADNHDLLRITIGSACTRLDEAVLNNCPHLQQIVFEGSTVPACHAHYAVGDPVIGVPLKLTDTDSYIGHNPEYLPPGCKIYVPCDALDAFKSVLIDYTDKIYGYGGDCGDIPPITDEYKFRNIRFASFNESNVIPDELTNPGVINEATMHLLAETYGLTSNFTIYSMELGYCIRSIADGALRSDNGSSPIFRLYSVKLNDGLVSIGERAFLNYQGGRLIIPNSVTSIGESAFENEVDGNWHGIISELSIGSGITSIPDRCFARSVCNAPVITIPNHITSIGASAFTDCTATTAINISDSVSTIGECAFSGCTGLTELHIGSGITSIAGNAFYKQYTNAPHTNIVVEALTPPSIVFSNNERDVWKNSTMYVHCSVFDDYWDAYKTHGSYPGILNTIEDECTGKNLTRWVESGTTCVGYDKYNQVAQEVSNDFGQTWSGNGVTSATTLIETGSTDCGYIPPVFKLLVTYSDSTYTAEPCDSLSAVTSADTRPLLYSYTGTSVEIGDCVTSLSNYSFYDITGLTSVTMSDSVTNIGKGAFSNCSGLTTCNIGSGLTSIGEQAFISCTGLTSISIPDSVTSIDKQAFNACWSLSSATIGDGAVSIGENAFIHCTGLTNVTIGTGVTSIGQLAFYNCTSLSSITVNKTTPPTLGYMAFDSSSCPIYVPSGSVNSYKAASNWSRYSDRIQAIPS